MSIPVHSGLGLACLNRKEMQTLQLYSGAVDINQLPALLTKAQAITSSAEQQTAPILKHISELDFSTLPPQQGDQMDETLAGWQNWLKQGYDFINKERSVFTKAFAEVTSTFTAEEKKLTDIGERLKSGRNAWAKEKLRRIAEEEKKKQAEVQRQNAFAEYRKSCQDAINKVYFEFLEKTLASINKGYYNASLGTIDGVAQVLKEYQPSLNNLQFDPIPHHLLNGDEMLKIRVETEREMMHLLAASYTQKVNEEKQRLFDLIPSRKMELERIANDAEAAKAAEARRAHEEAERQEQLRQQAAQAAQEAEFQQSQAQMNALLETSAIAPAVEQTKGATVKQKYVISSHQDMGKIMQQWVSKSMPLLTLDELQKKLSFMITAANAALNKGEAIAGLATEEDVTVRRTAKKS